MNRRLLGVVTAVVLAVVGAAVLIGYVRGAEERATEGQELVPVLVVDGFDFVEPGTEAELIPIRVDEVPANVRLSSAVDDITAVEGFVAAVELIPGEQLLWDRLVEPEELEPDSPSRVTLPEGFMEVTIPLDAERALGGLLKPGSSVAIVATFDAANIDNAETISELPGDIPDEDGDPTESATPRPTPTLTPEPSQTLAFSELDEVPPQIAAEEVLESPPSTHILLHKVLITEVQAEQAVAVDALIPADDDAPVQAPSGGYLVTFAVRAYDVERLVFATENGRIWLARDTEIADENGTRPQTDDSIYTRLELPLVLPTPTPTATPAPTPSGQPNLDGGTPQPTVISTPTPDGDTAPDATETEE